MEMTDLIGPGSVVTNLRITSKKQALQELAKRAAELTAQPEWAILEVLIERERLGTTGVGNGIAIRRACAGGFAGIHVFKLSNTAETVGIEITNEIACGPMTA